MNLQDVSIIRILSCHHASRRKKISGAGTESEEELEARYLQNVEVRASPKCGTLTWWGGLSGLIKY